MLTTIGPSVAATELNLTALAGLMHDLYRQQLERAPDPYLCEHAEPARVAHQARVIRWYAPFLPATGKVLDVGCAHAPDACTLRAAFGDRFDLHGCDFPDAGTYRVFHEFADLAYSQLHENLALPYPDESFDCVVASGMLEHAAMDYEMLKELYRILKYDGRLIVTYLPNALSYREMWLRNVRRAGFHRRVYGRGEANRLLKRAGFYPIAPMRYQSFLWEKRLERVLEPGPMIDTLAKLMKVVFPIHVVSSTLCGVALKVHSM